MFIKIDGRKIFFDVDGEKLVPDGPRLREKPTLIVLHGAPGSSDHAAMKPWFKSLRDEMQIVYVDLAGAGRSDQADYSLENWADDLATMIDELGMGKPHVLGLSAGGMVAQAYAIKYSHQTSGVILASTQAKLNPERSIPEFERLGGKEAAEAARLFLTTPLAPDTTRDYIEKCHPLYSQVPQDPDAPARMIYREELAYAFHEPGTGVWYTMDFIEDLSKVTCPVLVLAGEEDPITPVADSQDIVDALTSIEPEYVCMEGCGHGIWKDKPEQSFEIIKDFVYRNWQEPI